MQHRPIERDYLAFRCASNTGSGTCTVAPGVAEATGRASLSAEATNGTRTQRSVLGVDERPPYVCKRVVSIDYVTRCHCVLLPTALHITVPLMGCISSRLDYVGGRRGDTVRAPMGF